jgi:hypothetical protein
MERLEAIERVTKEYAEYSRESFGLAGVVAAALLAWNIVLVRVASVRWDPIATVLGMVAWFLALRFARRWYQRRGAVTAPPVRGRMRWLNLAIVYFAALAAMEGLMHGRPGEADGAPYFWMFFAASFAIPGLVGLASQGTRGAADSLVTIAFTFAPAQLRHLSAQVSLNASQSLAMRILLGGAVAGLLGGLAFVRVKQHVAFGRLERRLAALRSAR